MSAPADLVTDGRQVGERHAAILQQHAHHAVKVGNDREGIAPSTRFIIAPLLER